MNNDGYCDALDCQAGAFTIQIAYLKDVKPFGTHGGQCDGGIWNIRDLNSLGGDYDFILSLSTNQFTLSEGTYDISATIPAFVTSGHKAILSNMNTGSVELVGSTGFSNNAYLTQSFSYITGPVTILEPTTFSIKHRCQVTSTYDFGLANNFGVDEVYTQVRIMRLK